MTLWTNTFAELNFTTSRVNLILVQEPQAAVVPPLLPPRRPPRQFPRKQPSPVRPGLRPTSGSVSRSHLSVSSLRRPRPQELAAHADDAFQLAPHPLDNPLRRLPLAHHLALQPPLLDPEVLDPLVRRPQPLVRPLDLLPQLRDPRVSHRERRAAPSRHLAHLPRPRRLRLLEPPAQRPAQRRRVRQLRLQLRDRVLLGPQHPPPDLDLRVPRRHRVAVLGLHPPDHALQLLEVAHVARHRALEPLDADLELRYALRPRPEGLPRPPQLRLEFAHGRDPRAELLPQRQLEIVVLVDGRLVLPGAPREVAQPGQEEVEDLAAVRGQRQRDLAGREVLELQAGGAQRRGERGDDLGRVGAGEAQRGEGRVEVDEGRRAVRDRAEEGGDLRFDRRQGELLRQTVGQGGVGLEGARELRDLEAQRRHVLVEPLLLRVREVGLHAGVRQRVVCFLPRPLARRGRRWPGGGGGDGARERRRQEGRPHPRGRAADDIRHRRVAEDGVVADVHDPAVPAHGLGLDGVRLHEVVGEGVPSGRERRPVEAVPALPRRRSRRRQSVVLQAGAQGVDLLLEGPDALGVEDDGGVLQLVDLGVLLAEVAA
ncbi:hypothetical protein CTA1_10582 [Colletotrichum tanaceti]|uniref:Uncharacterized protein n=1 Tax=Colletotrichum tanaceti TaxID=1306861 RepID=A0A4U6X0Z8_9PEZI|nr:hypothetical protein CTA1_10582 [Colletotrichum tanaceti]